MDVFCLSAILLLMEIHAEKLSNAKTFWIKPESNLCYKQFSSVQGGIYALEKAHIHSTPSLRSFPSVTFETVPMFIWLTMALSRPCYKQCCQTGKNLMSIPKRKIPLRTPLSRYVNYCSYHVYIYPLTEEARWQTYCKGVNQLDAEVIPVVDVWKKQGPMCLPTFLDTLLSAVSKQGD